MNFFYSLILTIMLALLTGSTHDLISVLPEGFHHSSLSIAIPSADPLLSDHESETEGNYGLMKQDLINSDLQNKILIHERTMLWVALLLTIAIGFMIYCFTHQKRLKNKIELERSRSYIQGMEEERRNLARELHDGVAADLVALRLILTNGDGNNKVASEMVEQLHTTVRSISHRLMPPDFNDNSLGDILRRYIKAISQNNNSGRLIRADFVEADVPHNLPSHVSREIYRIFQEEIANILRHGHPSHIDVALQGIAEKRLSLTIDHDGLQSPEKIPAGHHGIGHRTIDERLKIIGATLIRTKGTISSTVISVKIP